MSTKKPKHRNNKGNASRTLVLAALMTSGMLQPLLPAFAAGTAPGDISNTATATYSDGTNTFNATSNTVKVTVAEVAGLEVKPAGIKDLDGGAVQAGDTLNFDFQVTNTGNSPTDIFIPNVSNIVAQNFNPTGTVLQYAPVDPVTGAVGSFVDVPSNGLVPNVGADRSIIVRVVGTVPTSGLSAGADIRVTLGDTLPNDNSPATQNQPDITDTALANEVRTVNVVGSESPNNLEREASATQFIDFATQVKPLALATLKKEVATVTANGAANTDDKITYALNLTVENTSPSGAFSPEQLAATDIRLEGAAAKKILVSDIIPSGTVFDSSIPPVAPPGWVVVYSTDEPTTTVPVVASGGLPAANWTTALPAPASIKRIGYIYDATTPLPANGTAITGFKFTVVTSNVLPQGGSVYNVAQVFGQTYDDPTKPVNPTTEIVYDESGDNNPNNFNDDQTPPDSTGSNFVPATDTGVPNPGTNGIDPGGNTGVGPNGELTRVNIGSVVAAIEDIFNGPIGQPGATGPTDANDDFTNVSTAVPPGTQNAFDPASVTIQHTVQNPATNTVTLNNVTIEPISPTQAEKADSNGTAGKFGSNASIPDKTKVTVTYLTQTAEYTYDSAKGIFVIKTGDKPVNVGDLTPGAQVNYSVTVDLPLDATLTKPLSSIPIPILAFSDDDPIASPGYNDTLNIKNAAVVGYVNKTPELNNNVTNDKVYLGFMELIKEARLLNAAGVAYPEGWLTTIPKALPGDVIEYRIKYKNISTPMQGSGNVVLNAGNFSILEDGGAAAIPGTTVPANNWAANTKHQPTTQFDRGTVEYFSSGVAPANSLGTTDPAANAQVGTYRNDVGTVAPGAAGEFLFRRQVNK